MARGSILTEWNDCGPAEDSSSSLPGLWWLTPWASHYMARVICCASRRRYPFTASVARRKGGQPNVSRPGQPCLLPVKNSSMPRPEELSYPLPTQEPRRPIIRSTSAAATKGGAPSLEICQFAKV